MMDVRRAGEAYVPVAISSRSGFDESVHFGAVVVLDRSGSMDGAPIHAVREAICNLLRLLGPNDRLGVVVFDDEAEIVLPLASHNPDTASLRVRAIETGGSTNLSGGWLKGLEMARTPRPQGALGCVTRCAPDAVQDARQDRRPRLPERDQVDVGERLADRRARQRRARRDGVTASVERSVGASSD